MTTMKPLADVLDLSAAIAKARRATEDRDPDRRFEAEQAALQRAGNLSRARPRLPEEDLERLRRGDVWGTKHIAVVRAWFDRGKSRILCLGGTTGTGKSFAAGWALAAHGGAYISAHDLGAWSVGSWRQREKLEERLGAGLLVLDDLGTEPNLDEVHAPLLDLVDRRQGRPWRTIITTNLPVKLDEDAVRQGRESLMSRYPEPRLWSRLARSWDYVGSGGEDLRRRT